jgi:amino acid transporter
MTTKKLSLTQATLVGVAGNAPTYSIAVTSAALVAAVGAGAPIAIFLCGLVILGILFSYARLNEEIPNAGAAYSWIGTILHPVAGFFAGWCMMMAAIIFMISATLPAGKATLLMVAPQYVDDKIVVTAVAIFWLVFMTAIVARGVELLGRVQSALTTIEIGLILIMVIGVLVNLGNFDFSGLSRGFSIDAWSAQSIAKGLVVAIFFFWGWDVIFNLAEETAETKKTSSRAGLYAVLLLKAIFVFFAAVVATLLSTSDIEASGGNAIFALAEKLLPGPLSYIAVLTFLLSVIGGMEGSVILFSRTALAKARDRRLWHGFGRLHQRWETPALAVIIGSAIVLVLLLFSAAFETVEKVVSAAISTTGIMVAAYYGMAAVACAVYFMRRRETNLGAIMVYVIWPLVSALIFFAAALISLVEMDALTIGAVVVSMTLGLFVLIAHRDAMRVNRA